MRVKIVNSDGTLIDIVDVASNTIHRSSDGKDHSDTVLNNTHRATAHDYDQISGNSGDTDVTAAELEELSDGSETVLHSHAGGGIVLTPYTNLDSESNVLSGSWEGNYHAYKAQVAGWVSFYNDYIDTPNVLSIYVGATDDPVGAGVRIASQEVESGSNISSSVSALVAKDEYFECAYASNVAGGIVLFKGFDTLGNPIDQD